MKLSLLALILLPSAAFAQSAPQTTPGQTTPAPTDADAAPVVRSHPVVTLQPNESLVDCIPGDTIRFSGEWLSKSGLMDCFLEADRRPVASRVYDAKLNQPLDWVAKDAGIHTLRVGYVTENHLRAYTRAVRVNVLAQAPLSLTSFPHSSLTNVTVTLTPSSDPSFQPVRAEYFFHGESVGVATAAPFQATIPVKSTLPGGFPIGFQVYDASGVRYCGMEEILTIPPRLKVNVPPQIILEQTGQKVLLPVDVPAAAPVKEVRFTLDSRAIASATAAPFSPEVDLSDVASGDRTLIVQLVGDDGTLLDQDTRKVHILNKPDDARMAKEAKDEADREAAVAAAEANARAAEEARKDNGPTGPARKLLRTYFSQHPELGWRLSDVQDVRKSTSEIYPSDIYAVVIDQNGDPRRVIYSVNFTTQDVSNLIREW